MKHMLVLTTAALLLTVCASTSQESLLSSDSTTSKNPTEATNLESTEEKTSDTSIPQTATVPTPKTQARFPRTLEEKIVGVDKDDGSKPLGNIIGFDPKSSPFGNYDSLLIATIKARWNGFIGQHNGPAVGQVVVAFNLWSDGKVTNVKVQKSTANKPLTILCQRAVRESSPYEPWPQIMRDTIGSDRRFVRFTFYYTRDNSLHNSSSYGNKEKVQQQIADGADINTKNSSGQALLHSAAFEGNKEIVELLINKGAEVNARDKDNRTPLFWAASYGHKEIVELLINKGAEVNAKEKDNRTPLFWAAGYGHKEIIELLISKDVDVNVKANDGKTSLDWAIKQNQSETIDLLRKHGAKTGKELDAEGK